MACVVTETSTNFLCARSLKYMYDHISTGKDICHDISVEQNGDGKDVGSNPTEYTCKMFYGPVA